MLFLNINQILYKLIVSRTFIINANSEEEEILLANNNICFLLTRKESKQVSSLKKKNGFDFLYTFETLLYKEEKQMHILKYYPALLNLNIKYNIFIPHIINLLNNNLSCTGKALVLNRTKSGFVVNCNGIINEISILSFFDNLSKTWTKGKKFLNYKAFLKKMLYRLNLKLFWETKFLFLKLKKDVKQWKLKKKQIKKVYIKPTILYVLKK